MDLPRAALKSNRRVCPVRYSQDLISFRAHDRVSVNCGHDGALARAVE